VLEKLEKVDELVVQVQRVADALERMTEVRLKTPEDDLISWLESRGEETETVERIDKGKGREVVEVTMSRSKWMLRIEEMKAMEWKG